MQRRDGFSSVDVVPATSSPAKRGSETRNDSEEEAREMRQFVSNDVTLSSRESMNRRLSGAPSVRSPSTGVARKDVSKSTIDRLLAVDEQN